MRRERSLRVQKAISFVSTQTTCTEGSVLLTGSVIEEGDDAYRSRKHQCKFRSPVAREPELQEPILLRATRAQRAQVVTFPPPLDAPVQELIHLLHQPLNVSQFRLTPSAENKIYVSELHVGSFGETAKREFVLKTPIREVHWELCPPSRSIEKGTTVDVNRKRAQLMFAPGEALVAQNLRIKWLSLHYTLAHGRHYAVPTCITGAPLYKIKRMRAVQQKSREIQVHRLLPPVPIMFKQYVKSPPINEIILKTSNSEEPRQVVRVTVDEPSYNYITTASRATITHSSYVSYSDRI